MSSDTEGRSNAVDIYEGGKCRTNEQRGGTDDTAGGNVEKAFIWSGK